MGGPSSPMSSTYPSPFRLDHHLDVLDATARDDVRQRLLRHAEQA